MRFGIFVLAAFLGGCGGGGSPPAPGQASLAPRPAGAPDVVILSVAGHAGGLNAILCTDDDNYAYLADPGSAVEALLQAFAAVGLTAETADFSDRFASVPGDPLRGGFLDLLATLDFVFNQWIDGIENPTRIVMVAHSHGTNWTHIAASLRPEIPLAYQITLDGICTLWECEHEDVIAAHVSTFGPFAWDIENPCDHWNVPGEGSLLNTKDVVFPSVQVHLEVRSDDIFVSDSRENIRLDGTLDDLLTFLSVGESHNRVRSGGSVGMAFVVDAILALEAPE